jgi:integrase
LWAQHWIDSDPTKRPRTRVRDEEIIRLHLLPAFLNAPLGAISPVDVQRLVRKWSSSFAPSTVRRVYAVLRAILNAAVEADLIGRSPCRGVKLPAVEQQHRHIITPDELVRLGNEVGDDYRTLVYLGAMTGLRIGELTALRVGGLDLLRGALTVAESKSAAGRRTFTLPRTAQAMLSDHLQRRGVTGGRNRQDLWIGFLA